MPSVSLSPIFNGWQGFTPSGIPLALGLLYTYQAGTNTPALTYTTNSGITPNANPIALDSGGRPPQEIWLDNTLAYKFILTDSVGNVLGTYDNIVGLGNAVNAFAQDLANTTDPAKGDALVGVKRTDVAGAPGLTLHDWNQADPLNVLQLGVKGDGVTDDAPRLNVLGALGIPLLIPYTSAGYLIGSSVTFSCDVNCQGTFNPLAAIGGGVHDYDRFAIILPSAGYALKRRFVGIRVAGSVALRAANVSGIRNDCENSYCLGLHAFQLNYGIVARSYSQTYDKCNANQCNTNFDAYARDSSHEINALSIIGGNYDSAVTCAINIGDTTWSDALAVGTSHGVVITIIAGTNTDGAETKIDNVSCVHMRNFYCETSATQFAIKLGGSGDGNLRNVDIDNCFFNTVGYAIYCLSAVNGLEVGRNFYTTVTHSALYVGSDLYHTSYIAGDATASFTQGQEFHTGFRSLPDASVTFANITAPQQGISRGVQALIADVGFWYPSGQLRAPSFVSTMNASVSKRFYTAPSLVKAGTVAGSVFTFTTLADCYAFNGGDAIVTAPAGAVYVRSVDYVAGTMVIDGGATAPGAATVSQQLAVFETKYTAAGVPGAGLGSNNNFYFRTDGVAGNAIYQKRAGAWAAVA